MLKSIKYLLYTLLICFQVFGNNFVYAQISKNFKLENKIETYLSEKISRFIKKDSFYLSVEIHEINSQTIEKAFPYAPKKDFLLNQMSAIDIIPHLKKVSVDFKIAEHINKDSITSLNEIIRKELGIKDEEKLKISISAFKIKSTENKNEISPEDKKNIEKKNESQNSSPLKQDNSENLKFYILISIGFFGITLGFLSFFLLGKSIKSIGGSISEALASSVQSVSSTIQAQSKSNSPNLQDVKSKHLPSSEQLKPENQINLQEGQDKLLSLHGELNTLIQDDCESIVIEYFNNCLLDDHIDLSEVILTMELIGRKNMAALFEKLCSQGKQKIIEYMRTISSVSANKMQKMISGGEKLRTFIYTSKVIKKRGVKNEQLSRITMEFESHSLINTILELSEEELSRVLFHLDFENLKSILKKASHLAPTSSEKLLIALSRIPDQEENTRHDENIIRTFQSSLENQNKSNYTQYKNYFKTIIESLDNDFAEKAKEAIGKANSELHAYLENSIVTFSAFYRLTNQNLETVINQFDNYQLAISMILSPEEKGDQIKSFLGTKQLEIINEEILSIENMDEKIKSLKISATKNEIVAIMKSLLEKNEITFEHNESQETLRIAS